MNFQRQENSQCKEKIIGSLNQEADELKQQHQHYRTAAEEVSRLSKRYQKMRNEKGANDMDHKLKVEQNEHSIQNLKLQLQDYRRELRSRVLEGQELRSEETCYKDMYLKREHDVSSARRYLHELMAEQNQLREEQRNLENVVNKMHQDKENILMSLQERQKHFRSLQDNGRELDSQVEQRGNHIAELNTIIISLKESIEVEEKQATEVQKQIDTVLRDSHDLKERIQGLQRQTSNRLSQKETATSKSKHYLTHLEQQRVKSLEQASSIEVLQKNYHEYNEVIEVFESDIAELVDKSRSFLQRNHHLVADIDMLRTHMELMGQLNTSLSVLLERSCNQDHEVLLMVDRKQRVKDRKLRTEEGNAKLQSFL